MTTEASQLVGHWEKTTLSACSRVYPDRLEFRSNGSYFAENNPNSPMIIWDIGEYRIESPGQLRITLANDASEIYIFSISNDTLTLGDQKNCEFKYQKLKP